MFLFAPVHLQAYKIAVIIGLICAISPQTAWFSRE